MPEVKFLDGVDLKVVSRPTGVAKFETHLNCLLHIVKHSLVGPMPSRARKAETHTKTSASLPVIPLCKTAPSVVLPSFL